MKSVIVVQIMLNRHTTEAKHQTSISYFSTSNSGKRRPALVLLHGLGSNHTRWQEFVAQTKLSNHWRIIAPDLRGHGYSMSRGTLTMELLTDDLVSILTAEGYDNAVIAGHSLGAHVAIVFAQRYPNMTRGIVLIDPLDLNNLTGSLKWFRRLRGIGFGVIQLIRLLNTLGLKRRTFPYRNLHDLDITARELIAEGKSREMVALYSSVWVDLKYNATANYFQFIYQALRPINLLKRVHAPVLLLLSKGTVFSQTNQPHSLLEYFDNCTVNVIACNHWLLTEKPRIAREAIESWINNHFA